MTHNTPETVGIDRLSPAKTKIYCFLDPMHTVITENVLKAGARKKIRTVLVKIPTRASTVCVCAW